MIYDILINWRYIQKRCPALVDSGGRVIFFIFTFIFSCVTFTFCVRDMIHVQAIGRSVGWGDSVFPCSLFLFSLLLFVFTFFVCDMIHV